MSLGKPKPHTAKEIRERREQILLLMARGYNQTDIAKELNTTRQTVMKDMKNINEMTNKGLYDLAKATLSTMYFNCVIGLNEVQKECWKIYNNEDNDPTINNWHKIAALRLTRECNESKFNIFLHAPTVMQIEVLKDRVERLKEDALNDKDSFRQLPYHDGHHHDLDSSNNNNNN